MYNELVAVTLIIVYERVIQLVAVTLIIVYERVIDALQKTGTKINHRKSYYVCLISTCIVRKK